MSPCEIGAASAKRQGAGASSSGRTNPCVLKTFFGLKIGRAVGGLGRPQIQWTGQSEFIAGRSLGSAGLSEGVGRIGKLSARERNPDSDGVGRESSNKPAAYTFD